MSINFLKFPNLGVLKSVLTDEDLAPIRAEVQEIQDNFLSATPHNKMLVGNIRKEYRLTKCQEYLNNLIIHHIREYDNEYEFVGRSRILTNDVPLTMTDPWVNFMSKHEFNPVHNHTGLLSFVLWLQIPYKIEDEIAISPGVNSLNPLAGQFSFHFSNILGQLNSWHIPADQSWENTLLLFPAELSHSVNPFYSSDDYRISVAGNVKFQT